MSRDKKNKKNGIEKLRMVLDDSSFNNLNAEDEKYLKMLKEQLDESSGKKINFKEVVHKSKELSKEELLKPKVVIHERVEKKPFQIHEFKEVKEEPEVIEKQVDTQAKEQDLIEIKKINSTIPEFIQVKPKKVEKEDNVKSDEEKIITVYPEESKSEKGLEDEAETIEKELEKEISKVEEIPQWQEIDSDEQALKEEEKLIESTDETIYCSECNCILDSEMLFCYKCGKKTKDYENNLENSEETLEKTIEMKDTKIEEVDNEINLDEKTKPFEDIESIDEKIAIALYDMGYISPDSLKSIDVKELKKILGIKSKTAKQIRKEIDEKIIEETNVETIDIEESSQETVINESLEIEEKQTLYPTELSRDEELIPLQKDLEISKDEEKELKKDGLAESERKIEEEIADFAKIQIFKELKSVDDKLAVILYNNGFTSLELLKRVDYENIGKISGIKKKDAKKIIKEIQDLKNEEKVEIMMSDEADYFKDEESLGKEIKQIDDEIKDFNEEKPLIDEDLLIEEEVKKSENDDLSKIHSIDGKNSKLLNENNIKNIQDLENTTIKELIKIKGIKRRLAKQIKKEVREHLDKKQKEEEIKNMDKNPFIDEEEFEEDEWTLFDEASEEDKKSSKKEFMYGEYTLYGKEITNKNGKKRTVRFFSKGEPVDAEPITLPKGYEVKENKKTGVPYLRKKK
jgi:hypothetical protein